jgi:hypothetical protein
MKYKEHGGNLSWPISTQFPGTIRRHWGKPQEISVVVAGVSTIILTGYLRIRLKNFTARFIFLDAAKLIISDRLYPVK